MMRLLTGLFIICICFTQACVKDDDPSEFPDMLGDLLTEEATLNYLWWPANDEIIYVKYLQEQSGLRRINAVNVNTRVQRTVLTLNDAITKFTWKNNDHNEVLVFTHPDGSSSKLELLNLNSGSRQAIFENPLENYYSYLPSIFSNSKFMVCKRYVNNTFQLSVLTWDDLEITDLGDMYPMAYSPDFNELIAYTVDISGSHRNYFIYNINTKQVSPLEVFNDFNPNLIEWTANGLIGYDLNNEFYIRINTNTSSTIQYNFDYQQFFYAKGGDTGDSFIFLKEICAVDNSTGECDNFENFVFQLYVNDIAASKEEKLMQVRGKYMTNMTLSPDEKSVVALINDLIYYKKIKD